MSKAIVLNDKFEKASESALPAEFDKSTRTIFTCMSNPIWQHFAPTQPTPKTAVK